MRIEIKNLSGKVIYQCKAESISEAVRKAIEVGADLRGADLSKVNLDQMDLKGADLSGADIRGTEMFLYMGSRLCGVNFSGANLSGIKFASADMTGVKLIGANLSGTKWLDIHTDNTNISSLANTDLRNADLGGFIGSVFKDLSGANLSGNNLTNKNLSGVNLSGANLSRANLSGVDLSKADLSDADLTNADLSGVNLKDANLQNANFIGAILTGVTGLSQQEMKKIIEQNKKDIIEKERLLVNVKQVNTMQPSLIFCDKIEYIHNRGKYTLPAPGSVSKFIEPLARAMKGKTFFDHHLMFYNKGSLVFKIWLKNEKDDKEYSDIYEALKDVGMDLRQLDF